MPVREETEREEGEGRPRGRIWGGKDDGMPTRKLTPMGSLQTTEDICLLCLTLDPSYPHLPGLSHQLDDTWSPWDMRPQCEKGDCIQTAAVGPRLITYSAVGNWTDTFSCLSQSCLFSLSPSISPFLLLPHLPPFFLSSKESWDVCPHTVAGKWPRWHWVYSLCLKWSIPSSAQSHRAHHLWGFRWKWQWTSVHMMLPPKSLPRWAAC